MQTAGLAGQRRRWVSGMWADQVWATDYRAEWLGDILVERATIASNAVSAAAAEIPMSAEAHQVVARFWLMRDDFVVDKVFDTDAEQFAYFIPVTTPLSRDDDRVTAETLYLGLHIDARQRITVLGEECFERALANNKLTPVETEHAEHSIRDMTLAAASNRFPPAFVRNFSLAGGVAR